MRVDPGLLQLASRLRWTAPRYALGARQGERRGRATGQGQEFADFRPYHTGDDLRRVDWNAYQRLESLLLRLSHEDRDQRILIIVDATGSMGMEGKADHAASLAAGLALAGLAARDQIRLGCFSGDGPRLITGEDTRALPAMIQALEAIKPGGAIDGREAVMAWARGKRFDRAVLISDMLIEPEAAERLLSALAVTATQRSLLLVLSESDRDPDLSGSMELEDAESGERLLLEGGPELSATYRAAFDRWSRGLKRLCQRFHIQHVDAPTHVSPGALLVGPLRQAGMLTGARRGGI